MFSVSFVEKEVDKKKLHKYDAALHSRMTMNIDGGEKGNQIFFLFPKRLYFL